MKSKFEVKNYNTLEGILVTIFVFAVLAGIIVFSAFGSEGGDGWLKGGLLGLGIILGAYLYMKIIELFIDIAKNTAATRELLENATIKQFDNENKN